MVSTFTCDILVIGTGAAGLRAAIEVESKDVTVILVSKAPAGYNNTTIVAGAGYYAPVKGLSKEDYLEETVHTGKNLNDPKLVKILAQEAEERVLELDKFGLDITVRKGGIHVGGPGVVLGQGISLPMVKYLREKGVTFVENTIITKLLKQDHRVVGAVGYNAKDQEPALFKFKAVIVATGGAGALFKRTDCPLMTTGDGYSLGFHAGARLRDMEFVQYFPLALAEPGVPALLVDGRIIHQGKIINSRGEDVPAKHNVTERPYIAKSRDLLSRAMMIEILEFGDIDGAVFIDGREVMKDSKPGDKFGMGDYDFYINKLRAHERPIRVAPLTHFTMGGIVANIDGETDVPGLFAAGEVVGGVHGANRHGGNALTAGAVFAVRAGKAAIKYVKRKDVVDVEELATSEVEKYEALLKKDHGYSAKTIMDSLRENMWEKVGIVRNAESLLGAYQKTIEYRDTTRRLFTQHGKPLLSALEVLMALDVSELIIRAAMERTESRGAHYRTDYPHEDPEWLKTVILQKKGQAIHVTTVPLGEAFE